MKDKEMCCICGRDVRLGSGNFVDRVAELSTQEERKDNGYEFPEGGYICITCATPDEQLVPKKKFFVDFNLAGCIEVEATDYYNAQDIATESIKDRLGSAEEAMGVGFVLEILDAFESERK